MSIVLWVVVILAVWLLLGAVIAVLLGLAIARNEQQSRAARSPTAEAVPQPRPGEERAIPSPRTTDTPRPRRRVLDPTRPPRGRRDTR